MPGKGPYPPTAIFRELSREDQIEPVWVSQEVLDLFCQILEPGRQTGFPAGLGHLVFHFALRLIREGRVMSDRPGPNLDIFAMSRSGLDRNFRPEPVGPSASIRFMLTACRATAPWS